MPHGVAVNGSALRAASLVVAVIGLGCDCARSSEGVVTDSATGAAIEGVQCRPSNGGAAARATDAAGHYRVEGLFGAGFPRGTAPTSRWSSRSPGTGPSRWRTPAT